MSGWSGLARRDAGRVFRDRREAGEVLAQELASYRDHNDLLVLGLARGGVPVGWQVAHALRAPLDVFLVRKLGVPQWQELAMGALASGGGVVINDSLVRSLGIGDDALQTAIERETDELHRREQAYRGDRPPVDLVDKTVILVDDGIATGASMLAAVRAVRAGNPTRGGGRGTRRPAIGVPRARGRSRRRGVRDDAARIRGSRSGVRGFPPGHRRRSARITRHTNGLAVTVLAGDVIGLLDDRRLGFVLRLGVGGKFVVRIVLVEFHELVLAGFARVTAGAIPHRIDDQQQHADDAGGDTDPRDQLIAGDDGGHQRGKADDCEDERNDQH